ncbi:MAG: hypothetical protein QW478_14550 [Candidatus Micrarchaeaceae archaeon]
MANGNYVSASIPVPDWKILKGKPYVTVSAKGISNGLSNIPNDGADFGPDTLLGASSPDQYGPPYTQTSGIQEAINYLSTGGEIHLRAGTYTVNELISVPSFMTIRGEGRGVTVLNGLNFFQGQQNVEELQQIEISDMTMQSTGTSSSGGYFFVISDGNILDTIILKNLVLLGGGNVGTGPLNIGRFSPSPIEYATVNRILLENIYYNTNGTTNGSEAITFPLISGNITMHQVNITNSSGPLLDVLEPQGGYFRVENCNFGSGNTSYIISIPNTTTQTFYIDATECINPTFTFNNKGYNPAFVSIHDSIANISLLSLISSQANAWLQGIIIKNIKTMDNWTVSGVGADMIDIDADFPNGWNEGSSAQSLLNLSAPPPSARQVNININANIGTVSNQEPGQLIAIPASSSVPSGTVYNINAKGIYPFTQASAGVIIVGSTTYSGLRAFDAAVNANPNYIVAHIDMIDTTTGTHVRLQPAITLPANPPVSGTVYQNNTGYNIKIMLPVYATTSGTAGTVAIALGSTGSPSTITTIQVAGTTSASATQLIVLDVPSAWYYEFTATGVTFATATVMST